MAEDLQGIAKKLGIATRFTDAGLSRRDYEVSPEIIKFFIRAFGYTANSEAEIAASLQEIELERWKHALEPIYIVEEKDVALDLVVFADFRSEPVTLELKAQGSGKKMPADYEVIDDGESAVSGMMTYFKLKIKIHTPLPVGYYDVKITHHGKTYKTVLAVAPERCYEAPAMAKKLWGYAVQLYSLRSERNWGVGDFTDLKTLVRLCGETGADVIGLNPLNVLSHDYPEDASPYLAISRLFLNPIYIDVEAVPEFEAEDISGLQKLIDELRHSELIRYADVYNLKISVLNKCYLRMLTSEDQTRRQAFEKFCRDQGDDLHKLAVFQTISHQSCNLDWGGWRSWPKQYQNPRSLEVGKFADDNREQVDFFKFLQFEADRQLAEAADLVKEQGLGVGFYRDLAVGVGTDSAELWSNPDLFFKKAGTGAPPDAFFPAGQKWGLGTFNPRALKQEKYLPFIKILRANMRSAGALRIDHVMSLMRLYVIPDCSDLGTYIFYNFADMLNIVALESHLNKCAVVGESIGNVPAGFLEILAARNVHSLSVLWAERYNAGWGDFHAPEAYPVSAFASVGTHDMAPLKMWWFGYDIELSFALGLIPNEHEKNEAYHKRENDRWKLLNALDAAQVWPADNMRTGNYLYGEGYPEGIDEAVHRFMARTTSQVFLAQLEDILHVDKLQNLPGTDRDKHPNWRRRLPVSLEQLPGDIAYRRNIAAIKTER